MRSKLLEYYATEGKDDALRIEIPKGSYVVVFHHRQDSGDAAHSSSTAAIDDASALAPVTRPEIRRGWPPGALVAAVIAGLAIGAVIAIWVNPFVVGFSRNGPNVSLQRFWRVFTEASETTIVVFSNARFVGDGETGLRYYDPAIDRPEQIKELHTGIGEVIGIYELGSLFRQLGAEFEIKRAALVDWHQVKKANVIFLGGPSENTPVRELRNSATFVFETREDPDGSRRVVIVNRRRAQGEPALFDAGTAYPMRRDYAIIRLQDGFVPSRNILVLAGITTLGTQGAVEFVCQRDTIEALFEQQESLGADRSRLFEAVLDIEINGGVPVGSKIVAFHALDPS